MPLCEGSQHHMQQVLVEGLERNLRLVQDISARLGIGASASVVGLVLEFEAKIRAAKGEVQHEAPARMAGDKSQLEVCAWPFLRAERAACVAKGAARLAAGSRRRSDVGVGKHLPSNLQLKAKEDNGDGEAQHLQRQQALGGEGCLRCGPHGQHQ